MTYSIPAILIVLSIILFVACKPRSSATSNSDKGAVLAKQIKIDELPTLLSQLENKQLQYDFFGITSNGTDCIYFIPKGSHFDLEFEVMTDDQKPYLDKLRSYAETHHWSTASTTYGNTPKYQSSSPAPVLQILTNANKQSMATLGKQLMIDVFSNSDSTTYDVVP